MTHAAGSGTCRSTSFDVVDELEAVMPLGGLLISVVHAKRQLDVRIDLSLLGDVAEIDTRLSRAGRRRR